MKSQAFSTYVKILALQLLVVAACLGVNSGCANKTSGDDTDARGVATLAGGTSANLTNCDKDSKGPCIVDGAAYVAVKAADLSASSLPIGVTVAGIKGTASVRPADCASDGQTGCVATSGYPAAKVGISNLDESNIKRGVTIAGVTGKFPSASYPLDRYSSSSGASTAASAAGGVTTDFTNFISQLTSAGSFEFWDKNGVRYTGSGSANLTTANVKSGITLDNVGVSGTAVIPDPWDVRVGSAVGTATGKLPVNCRNGGNTSKWDITMPLAVTVTNANDTLTSASAHGFATADAVRISYSTVPTGLDDVTTYYVINTAATTLKLATSAVNAGTSTAIDITADGVNVVIFKWNDGTLSTADTIDDYNGNNAAAIIASPFASSTFCSGVEASAGDTNVWKDVTTTAGGAGSTCAGTGANCTYQDKISGLWWSKTKSTTGPWGMAMDLCYTLTYNNLTGWRLPTQKEWMGAYEHGIRQRRGQCWRRQLDDRSRNGQLLLVVVDLLSKYDACVDRPPGARLLEHQQQDDDCSLHFVREVSTAASPAVF